LLLPLFERDVLPDDAFPRFATGACTDVPLSARLTAVFFDAPAAVFAAASAPLPREPTFESTLPRLLRLFET
jgi:hypothetical protein